MIKILSTEDKVQDDAIVTSGLFQDGASSITSFFTSSTQYTNTGDYNVDIYRYNPANNASASIQFGLAYGHVEGSGSLGTPGATGDRTTAAVFGQFNQLINPPQTQRFVFSANTTSKEFYALSFNRARMRDQLEPGGWELHLSGSKGIVKLKDDSSDFPAGTSNARNFSPEYNVVSGTIAAGTAEAATANSDSGSYGNFYPSLGIILLNPLRIDGHFIGAESTVRTSNNDSRNARKLYNAISGGAYFQAKREEEVASRHFFVRAKAGEFNGTTNETFYTESVEGIKETIGGLATDPRVYITTVGLYNNEEELIAIAKLSQPILKTTSREALIKVKLDF